MKSYWLLGGRMRTNPFYACTTFAVLWGYLTIPSVGALTNPVPNQVFATGTPVVKFAWDPVADVNSYDLTILRNGTTFTVVSGIVDTATALTNAYTPGCYTAFVRGVNETNAGTWSDPVSFFIHREMAPDENLAFITEPTIFKWTRGRPATRYLLKLAQLNPKTGFYFVKETVWIQQPSFGSPQWRPAATAFPIGKFRWSITDYVGDKPGYTSLAYFQVIPLSSSRYLVVDLSGGPNAGSYPVTGRARIPVGGWGDSFKTTKLVMRKIPPGVFIMGSPPNELGRSSPKDVEQQHQVTLTKAFYIGVFEVTQRQWELVMGNRPSYFYNRDFYASRPVEQVLYSDIRGKIAGAQWPLNGGVDATSFMGKLRTKTGLSAFDLPTEAQWEYACRAGTTTALNSGMDLTSLHKCRNMSKVGRYWYNGGSGGEEWPSCGTSMGTAKVGSYLPNAWGLYDMHGNVWEWCLDRDSSYYGNCVDPVGNPVAGDFEVRVVRGGEWQYEAQHCRSAERSIADPSRRRLYVDSNGFRVAMTLP